MNLVSVDSGQTLSAPPHPGGAWPGDGRRDGPSSAGPACIQVCAPVVHLMGVETIQVSFSLTAHLCSTICTLLSETRDPTFSYLFLLFLGARPKWLVASVWLKQEMWMRSLLSWRQAEANYKQITVHIFTHVVYLVTGDCSAPPVCVWLLSRTVNVTNMTASL